MSLFRSLQLLHTALATPSSLGPKKPKTVWMAPAGKSLKQVQAEGSVCVSATTASVPKAACEAIQPNEIIYLSERQLFTRLQCNLKDPVACYHFIDRLQPNKCTCYSTCKRLYPSIYSDFQEALIDT